MKTQTIATKHSYNLGDIIFTLWAVRQLATMNNATVDYYQWLNRKAHYYDGAEHPTKDKNGDSVCMNEVMFEMMKPLMESLPYINSFLPWKGQRALNLDRTRLVEVGMPNHCIPHWYMHAYPELFCDISQPVITKEDLNVSSSDMAAHDTFGSWVSLLEDLNESIVIGRSSRYRNPAIHYGFLNELPQKKFFVGTLEEYEDFQDDVQGAIYLQVPNFRWLAIYILHSKVFLGNQSFCYSLAEAMKVPRVLELCKFAPNVIPTGANGYSYYSQEALEYFTRQLAQ